MLINERKVKSDLKQEFAIVFQVFFVDLSDVPKLTDDGREQ